MTERMVVVGGDAAGMSAASQAKRLRGDRLEVLAFERGAHSSYSACGIPYWVAGDVPDGEQLVARTPEAHRANGIDLRMLTDVEAIDLQGGTVELVVGQVLKHRQCPRRISWRTSRRELTLGRATMR